MSEVTRSQIRSLVSILFEGIGQKVTVKTKKAGFEGRSELIFVIVTGVDFDVPGTQEVITQCTDVCKKHGFRCEISPGIRMA